MIRSVTKNGRSILLTAVLAFILIYLFSIVGFVFFKEDFMIEVDAADSVGASKGTCLQIARGSCNVLLCVGVSFHAVVNANVCVAHQSMGTC